MQGGELIFEMGSEPNLERGLKAEDKPYSMTE
jgi:putative alpha-1,2-mannosidase